MRIAARLQSAMNDHGGVEWVIVGWRARTEEEEQGSAVDALAMRDVSSGGGVIDGRQAAWTGCVVQSGVMQWVVSARSRSVLRFEGYSCYDGRARAEEEPMMLGRTPCQIKCSDDSMRNPRRCRSIRTL